MLCPRCKSADYVKDGSRMTMAGRKQRYSCKSCGYKFSDDIGTFTTNPKLLYFDIETAPNLAWVWHTGKYYIRPEDIEQEWFVLSWAAKWVCDNKIFSDVVTIDESVDQDDERICKRMWELFDEADVIIGHNSRRFDIRKMNDRFIFYGFPPPSHYKTIDTLVESRKVSASISHKLDYLAKKHGVNGGKIENDFELWKRCVKGDKNALSEMVSYNEHDILIGEEIYMLLRPWMTNHPNMGLYYSSDDFVCKNCGSEDLNIIKKPYHTPANSYKSWSCNNCGANGRTNIAIIDTEKRRSLLK